MIYLASRKNGSRAGPGLSASDPSRWRGATRVVAIAAKLPARVGAEAGLLCRLATRPAIRLRVHRRPGGGLPGIRETPGLAPLPLFAGVERLSPARRRNRCSRPRSLSPPEPLRARERLGDRGAARTCRQAPESRRIDKPIGRTRAVRPGLCLSRRRWNSHSTVRTAMEIPQT